MPSVRPLFPAVARSGLLTAASALAALAACVARPRVAAGRADAPSAEAVERGGRGGTSADLSSVYRQMGRLVGRGELAFVGTAAYFATPSPDSTLVLLALSLPNRALSFAREGGGDRYRASYEVRIDVRRGATLVRRVAADEVVRVDTFRETTRADESVLFHQYVTLAPGEYSLAVAVRDVETGRSAAAEGALVVPRLGPGALSTPVVAYRAVPRVRLDSSPRLAVSARGSVTFGEDSAVAVYVEGYPSANAALAPGTRFTVRVEARGAGEGAPGTVLWADTATLAAGAQVFAGVVRVPVARLGIGVVSLTVTRADAAAPAPSARAALFVSLGDDLPITGLDEVLGYLRYYLSAERLRALRDAAPDARPGAWASLLRETDPSPTTAEHEGLRDYFARLRTANARFADEGGPGWLTDRGMAFVGIGEPDQIFDPGGPGVNVRGRQQIWEYYNPRVRVVFVDQSGFGRWRLTPSSAADVQSLIRQRMVK